MMSGDEPRTINATVRFIRQAGRDNKVIVMLQRRFMLLFWKDHYPIDNATRALEHEAIELYDRLKTILDVEYKEASMWVKKAREKAEVDCDRKGKGLPFKDIVSAESEAEMPDLSERFNEIKKYISSGPKGQYRGTKTTYTLPKHAGLHDMKKLGQEYDHTMEYREPQQQKPSRNRGKNRNQSDKRHVLVEVPTDGNNPE